MLRPLGFALAAMFAFGAPAAASAADLTVVFIDPAHYTDAAYSNRYGNEKERAEVMRDVQRHLQGLSDRLLAPGDSLRIEVLDIDLAGWFEPFPRFRSGGGDYSHLRIMRDITWPRIKLRFELTHDGQVVTRGEEQVVAMNYLMTVNIYSPSDRLRYEKAMLDDWFANRIVGAGEHG
jgi:hypothetical protein